jgi:hypothetical protein
MKAMPLNNADEGPKLILAESPKLVLPHGTSRDARGRNQEKH